MARQTKLTDGLIDQICRYIKLRMKRKEIAEILGLHPDTIQRWVRDGEKAKSGLKRKLVDAMSQAQSESTAELSEIVFNAALIGSETVTEKVVRLPDGSTRSETITKRTPPSASEARRILALEHPDRWAEVKHIQYEWKDSLTGIGLDPEKVTELFFKRLAQQEGTSEKVEIPLIPEHTV